MIPKVLNYDIVFREFPNEITLALNFSGCPCKCKGCHSSYLAEYKGDTCDEKYIDNIIKKNSQVTCIGLMGGDAYPKEIERIAKYIKKFYNYKIGWYSGRQYTTIDIPVDINYFDYIKVGPYIEELGGLDSKSTNQIMYKYVIDKDGIGEWENITSEFWK